MEECIEEKIAYKGKKFKLDPRTKLFLIILITTAEFLYSHLAFMTAIALIPFILLLIEKKSKSAFLYIILFILALAAKESQNYLHFGILINMIVVFLVGVVLRLFPAFAMGTYIVYSTKASEFISAMGKMKVSRKITIPVSVVFRFIPTMRQESAAIKDAMRMREIQFGTKKFWKNPFAFIEYRLVPLMISIVKIGDELSAAALSRGLDNPKGRSSFTEVRFTVYDIATIIIVIIVLAICLL